MQHATRSRRARGFTLLELMVVVVILGVLTALVFPGIRRSWAKAQLEAARTQMSSLGSAVEMYRMSEHRFPPELKTLTEPDLTGEPFISHIPKDPWGEIYKYVIISKRRYEIRCSGADQQPGTDDDLIHPIVIRDR
jgi:general secretion pathway protein G